MNRSLSAVRHRVPLRGRIAPDDVFPAADRRFRVRWLQTSTGERVRGVETGPEDGLPVVLIPGWGCPAYVFRDLLPALGARGYRAMSVEPRGQGFSDRSRDPAAYETAAMTAHIVDIVDQLGVDELVLGGHSLGAALAARAAPRLAGRLRGLILLSPVGTHGQPRRVLARLVRPRALAHLPGALVTRAVVRLLLRMAAARGGIYSKRDIEEYWASSQYREYAPALLHLLRELDWGDRHPVASADFTVPTLVLYGAKDPLVRRTGAAERLRESPHVRVEKLRGVGHMVTDEVPNLVNAAVLRFLDSLRT